MSRGSARLTVSAISLNCEKPSDGAWVALRLILASAIESLQELELAAGDRYWEGVELLAAGRFGGGIYVLGYVAEIYLKLACFRLERVRPTDPVGPFFGPARTWMNLRCAGVDRESYHSLLFWLTYLRDKRRFQGRALTGPLDWELVRRARRLYRRWWVEMRYRRDRAQPIDGQIVYDDVTWFRDHYLLLWR